MIIDDFDFGFDKVELDGIIFDFKCKFRIIEYIDGYYVNITYLYKRSYNEKPQMNYIMDNIPIDICDVNGIELNDYNINKEYIGYFRVNYYEDNTYDLFILNYE